MPSLAGGAAAAGIFAGSTSASFLTSVGVRFSSGYSRASLSAPSASPDLPARMISWTRAVFARSLAIAAGFAGSMPPPPQTPPPFSFWFGKRNDNSPSHRRTDRRRGWRDIGLESSHRETYRISFQWIGALILGARADVAGKGRIA